MLLTCTTERQRFAIQVDGGCSRVINSDFCKSFAVPFPHGWFRRYTSIFWVCRRRNESLYQNGKQRNLSNFKHKTSLTLHQISLIWLFPVFLLLITMFRIGRKYPFRTTQLTTGNVSSIHRLVLRCECDECLSQQTFGSGRGIRFYFPLNKSLEQTFFPNCLHNDVVENIGIILLRTIPCLCACPNGSPPNLCPIFQQWQVTAGNRRQVLYYFLFLSTLFLLSVYRDTAQCFVSLCLSMISVYVSQCHSATRPMMTPILPLLAPQLCCSAVRLWLLKRNDAAAYKHADGKKIDGKRVLVDVERARTVKGWLPRRLGGGLGGTRRGGPDVNIKHSGREDNERERERYRLEREREDRDRRERDRPENRKCLSWQIA